jgi:large subunit ribosomal protein L17
MQIQKQFNDIFKEYGVLSRKVFLLCNPESVQGIKNISNIISSNQDDEVLMALVVYRDRKHRDEIVRKVLDDEKYHSIIQHFRNIITPGSDYIVGDFEPLNLKFG